MLRYGSELKIRTRVTIKWFDMARGGFASSPDFARDIFIGSAIVAATGLHQLYTGDSIDVLACDTARGPKATRLIGETLQRATPFLEGFVKHYSPSDGHGFVTLKDGKDVFVHRKILRHCNINEADLVKMAPVEVSTDQRGRGLFATALHII